MPVLVQAFAKRSIGWAALKFAYNEKAKNTIKAHPGARWIDPDKDDSAFADDVGDMLRREFEGSPKAWYVPTSLLPLLESDPQFKFVTTWDELESEIIAPDFAARLKPYQQEGFTECLKRTGFLLTYEPRVGKTATSIAAACALLEADKVDLVLVLYPNSVVGEWERQLDEWAGIKLEKLASFQPLLTMEVAELRARPYLFLGCHYEILGHREKCLARVVDGRRYLLIGDEVQLCKNRRSARYKTARRLAMGAPIIAEGDLPEDDEHASARCVKRIGLSGTEMRNRPRDLFGPLDLIQPGQVGGYWTFAKRFAAAHQDSHGHWNDKGKSNPDELRARLKLVSQKVTRAEAAPWLPKMERQPVLCLVPEAQLAKYRKLEAAYGKRINAALENDELSGENSAMLEAMDKETSAAKMDEAIKRALLHLDRGVKVRVSAHHHETIKLFTQRFDAYFDADHDLRQYPTFLATGYLEPDERSSAIKHWKSYDGAALLITNNLSTSVGIDLSEAKVSISIEQEWVPSDQEQWEARAMDVHHGKTIEPPLNIYLLVRGTIDEAKVRALLSKLRDIEEIVGKGTETSAMSATFRSSGVIDESKLGLESTTDRSVVAAALHALRERALRGPASTEVSLEAEMASWENDEEPEDEE